MKNLFPAVGFACALLLAGLSLSPARVGAQPAPILALPDGTLIRPTPAAFRTANGIGGGGVGDVVGPASSVNDRLAVFSGTTGKLIADGGYTLTGLMGSPGPIGATTPATGRFSTISIGGPYLGGGSLVVWATVTDSYNIDGQILNFNNVRTANGTSDNYGLSVQATAHTIPAGVTDAGTVTAITGDSYSATTLLAGTLTNAIGGRFRSGFATGTSGAVITNATALLSGIRQERAGTMITNGIGHKIETTHTAGTITNLYDLYAATAAANNYFAGKVGVGVLSPTYELEVSGDIGADNLAISGSISVTGTSSNNFAAGTVNIGAGAGTIDATINLGEGRASSGNAFLDLVGDTTYTDYGLRLLRNSGANGGASLTSRGTGTLRLSTAESGSIALATAGVDRFVVTPTGELSVSSSIELGHESDTTLSRLSAGVVGVEGSALVKVGSSPTLQNVIISGSLGIGVGSTSYELEVAGDVAMDNLTVSNSLNVNGAVSNNLLSGTLNVGAGAVASDATINLGEGRIAAGNAFIDLVGDMTYTGYGLRLLRNSGVNTGSDIISRGTGTLRFSTLEAGPIALATAGVDRLVVSAAGAVEVASTLELGHATDTTLSRVSAGVVAVEGVTVPTISSTSTITNKRITARITTITSSFGTPTINTDNCDCVTLTGVSAAITSMTTNLTGTPVNFDKLEFRIKDDGTARAITWGASFVSGNATLPTTTTASKVLRVWLEYDSVQAKWVCVGTGSDS